MFAIVNTCSFVFSEKLQKNKKYVFPAAKKSRSFN